MCGQRVAGPPVPSLSLGGAGSCGHDDPGGEAVSCWDSILSRGVPCMSPGSVGSCALGSPSRQWFGNHRRWDGRTDSPGALRAGESALGPRGQDS